ncbi:MAG: tRNA (adenosine(37)-N6)-threonylcarbamoyltransferase complex transferase subunit TsaD [Nitrospirota bacterium]|nr:tRNA (adenosine(37)-N6)-threonylcarbamoyltransferase complex transferase subunit TsaD [Nitrospirota bacterium]
MLILGIDTSCDDTSAAVIEDGKRILSNIISGQDKIHDKYGGIVPELASRKHIEMILPVVEGALNSAGAGFHDLSAIAVTYGPGLIGSLLIGVCFAKSISFFHKIPLIGVNHLEGHIHSIFLENDPQFPFIALIVSGGHTSICLVESQGDYSEISRTRDDAAGEAYDKVAKLLGLGYPGGPIIDKMASIGNPEAVHFPRANLKGSLDFSFSGLKTAVLTHIKKYPNTKKEDIAASFQASVIDVLVSRTLDAARSAGVKSIVLAGGVSANSALRETMIKRTSDKGIKVFLPSPHLCTDNAAMIAAAGYHHFKKGTASDLTLNPKAYMQLGTRCE